MSGRFSPVFGRLAVLTQLENAAEARALLERAAKRVEASAVARNFSVGVLREFRTPGLLGLNVGGREICVRLRAGNGALLPLADVTGTLLHELAHCRHHNHSAAFYALVDEMWNEVESGAVRNVGATPAPAAFGGRGQRLGGAAVRRSGPYAAISAGSGGGQRLGGAPQPRHLRPGEAAVRAAEQRAVRDRHWCGVLDLTADDAEGETAAQRKRKESEDDSVEIVRKRARSPAPSSTNDNLRKDVWICERCTFLNESSDLKCQVCDAERSKEMPAQSASSNDSWVCTSCTFINTSIVKDECEICSAKRKPTSTANQSNSNSTRSNQSNAESNQSMSGKQTNATTQNDNQKIVVSNSMRGFTAPIDVWLCNECSFLNRPDDNRCLLCGKQS